MKQILVSRLILYADLLSTRISCRFIMELSQNRAEKGDKFLIPAGLTCRKIRGEFTLRPINEKKKEAAERGEWVDSSQAKC